MLKLINTKFGNIHTTEMGGLSRVTEMRGAVAHAVH